jgi:hypothetical protein
VDAEIRFDPVDAAVDTLCVQRDLALVILALTVTPVCTGHLVATIVQAESVAGP